jgi:ribosomal protein S18 acetylase RimI-like enzyme
MKENEIYLESAPNIAGLKFRHFTGDSDFPKMIDIVNAAGDADQDDRSETLEDIKNQYSHLNNSDPYKDMIFAEVNAETVAYSRVEWWQEEDPNDRIYTHFVLIAPEWREKGIEQAMIQWCEKRLLEIAEGHPQDSKRVFRTYSSAVKSPFNKILESLGYEVERYFIEMSRSLDVIPNVELPTGIEVRAVKEQDERKVWDANVEAFRDHWGFSPPTEKDYVGFKKSKYWQPNLWQVAWDGDQVVSSVMNYIDDDHNEKFNRKRGWTENISTRREWRRRGIAKALIVRSMHMHKDKGMTEVALGVDTQNPSGALKLYESLGYEKDKTHMTFRKEM